MFLETRLLLRYLGALVASAGTLAGCSAIGEPRLDGTRCARCEVASPGGVRASGREHRVAVAKALHGDFDSVWSLSISGYSLDASSALATVASSKHMGETTRDYAAMGLRNFSALMPAEERSSIARQMRDVLAEEGADTPDGIIRLLVRWGDASYVQRTLGGSLAGHSMEITVLRDLPEEWAGERLWRMYLDCPESRKAEHYNRKAGIGRALVERRDKRGIDILVALLPADNAPSRQHRNNVFKFLALKIGETFGYEHSNYDPSLEEVAFKMQQWWKGSRSAFEFGSKKE